MARVAAQPEQDQKNAEFHPKNVCFSSQLYSAGESSSADPDAGGWPSVCKKLGLHAAASINPNLEGFSVNTRTSCSTLIKNEFTCVFLATIIIPHIRKIFHPALEPGAIFP
ncbi:MAG: hypothetical protein AB7H77_04540 [Bdellovibrionales bacterium]